jgi:pimeloyl-ACP methyl ester carboxylesterase
MPNPADMAKDRLAFIKALGYEKVDILAFPMGGFIIQELMAMDPTLVRKLIMAGTGPRGRRHQRCRRAYVPGHG